jgi:hypothetical protein
MSCLLACVLALPAQIGRIWTFADLLKECHVAVIGTVVKTTDTGRKVSHPGLKPPLPAVVIETEFEVLAVLKSVEAMPLSAGGRLVVSHYRIDWDQWRADHPVVQDQPTPGGVINTGSVLTFEPKSGPYLLFLVKTATGFEPVSGHTFPTESVFHLQKQGRP